MHNQQHASVVYRNSGEALDVVDRYHNSGDTVPAWTLVFLTELDFCDARRSLQNAGKTGV
jgi:hypothetical protein